MARLKIVEILASSPVDLEGHLQYATAVGTRQRGLSPEEVKEHIITKHDPGSPDPKP